MKDKSNTPMSLDLDWVAFQFFTGEITEEGRALFEDRLATDQLAREALARAVELTQVVAMVEASDDSVSVPSELEAAQIVPQNRVNTWMAPVAWLAVASLICVAALLYWNPLAPSHFYPGSQPLTENSGSTIDSGELASLWVETGEFLDATPLTTESSSVDRLLDDERVELQVAPNVDAEVVVDQLEAPSWMMAALIGSNDVEMQESRHEN